MQFICNPIRNIPIENFMRIACGRQTADLETKRKKTYV